MLTPGRFARSATTTCAIFTSEQLANGNWVVLDVNTGQIREISDYYLRNIHQDDYQQKGLEMAAWIESGCKM